MKVTSRWLGALFYVALLPTWVCGQEPVAKPPKVYDVDSLFEGVKFEVAGVVRTDPENVTMGIQVIATSLKGPMLIGFATKSEGDPKKKEISPVQVTPFSLMSATIIDQTTKNQYGAIPQIFGRPSYGPSSIVTTINPGSWFQMSVQFKLPVPPPNPNGTIPVQKIDVLLPQAKGPVKGVIVPPVSKK